MEQQVRKPYRIALPATMDAEKWEALAIPSQQALLKKTREVSLDPEPEEPQVICEVPAPKPREDTTADYLRAQMQRIDVLSGGAAEGE